MSVIFHVCLSLISSFNRCAVMETCHYYINMLLYGTLSGVLCVKRQYLLYSKRRLYVSLISADLSGLTIKFCLLRHTSSNISLYLANNRQDEFFVATFLGPSRFDSGSVLLLFIVRCAINYFIKKT